MSRDSFLGRFGESYQTVDDDNVGWVLGQPKMDGVTDFEKKRKRWRVMVWKSAPRVNLVLLGEGGINQLAGTCSSILPCF